MIVSLEKFALVNSLMSFSALDGIIENSLKNAGVTHKITNLPPPNSEGWIVKEKPDDSFICGVKWIVLDGLDEMEKEIVKSC